MGKVVGRPDQHSPVSAERGDGHRGWLQTLSGAQVGRVGGGMGRQRLRPDQHSPRVEFLVVSYS